MYTEADKGGILKNLYDDFVSAENASLNTRYDTILYIKDYCEHSHEDIMKEEQIKKDEAQAVFLGKDENGVAYYHFKESLSSSNLQAKR